MYITRNYVYRDIMSGAAARTGVFRKYKKNILDKKK